MRDVIFTALWLFLVADVMYTATRSAWSHFHSVAIAASPVVSYVAFLVTVIMMNSHPFGWVLIISFAVLVGVILVSFCWDILVLTFKIEREKQQQVKEH